MPSYSSDIAQAKLSKLNRELTSTPKEIDACLDACESKSEFFLILFTLIKELKKNSPELESEYKKLQSDYLRLNFGYQSMSYWHTVLSKAKTLVPEEERIKWESQLDRIQHILTTNDFPEILSARSQDSRRMFESIVSTETIANEEERIELRKFYPYSFPSNISPSPEQVEDFICNKLAKEQSAYAWRYMDRCFGDTLNPTQILNRTLSATKNYRGRNSRNPKINEDLPKIRSFGILRSTTPRSPYLLDKEIRFTGQTSQTDDNRPDYYTNPRNNWLRANPESPFVASYSGHLVWLIGLIIDHLNTRRQFDSLERQNQFVKIMMRNIFAVYIQQGFHSYQEMLTMFNDPIVIKDFRKLGITFENEEMGLFNPSTVELALLEAADYNKICLLKRASLGQLVARSKLKQDEITTEQVIIEAAVQEAIKELLASLKTAVENDHIVLINEKAMYLFRKAGAVRSFFAFDRGRFSTDTTACKALIGTLSAIENKPILEALGIKSDDTQVIAKELQAKMILAFSNKDVVDSNPPTFEVLKSTNKYIPLQLTPKNVKI